jgi:hypothetical protein
MCDMPATIRAAAKPPVIPGWTVGGNPSIDPTIGLPMPSWQLPGDAAYMWRDDHKAYTSFSYRMNSQGLADFFFGCNDKGTGQMFRIDTRASGNFAGFATTQSWTSWNAPSSGFYAPPNTWIQVTLTIAHSVVTARCTWIGGFASVRLTGYKPAGTAYGFQGDGLGATSYTWVSGFQATG